MQQASALNVQTSSAYVVKNGSINEQFLAAVDSGNISNVKTLLCEYRANTNYQNEDGTSAGMLASAQGNQGMLEILKEQHIHNSGLTQRAILTLQNNKQERALHFATANGNVNALKTLLSGIYLQEREHAVNAQSQGGITPLHIAATKGHAHLVTLLMESKGDINVQDNKGEVPLATARRFNQRHFINALSPYRKQMNKNKYLHNKDVFEEAFRWAAQQEKMQMQAQSTATSSSVTVEEVIDDNQPQPKTLQLENKQDS
jgi:ankyrin repeat protein